MSQGPSPMDMNTMAMDPNSMYYPNIEALPADLAVSQVLSVPPDATISDIKFLQGPSNGHDTSMTGMLEDSMLTDFDGIPMTLDVNSLENAPSPKAFPAINPSVSNNNLEQSEKDKSVSSPADKPMTGAGAGPLPTGFGAQSTLAGGSTLTEFTKRRNWPHRVVEELKDFLHILTPDGRIVYMSPSGKQLTGYPSEELVGKFIVDFIHPDDSGIFVR
jgi:hypothetical protein